MAHSIVITVDYEIFGNGFGDVRQHVTDPTERMCRIAEKYDVPITIYFELEEYLAFGRHASQLKRTLGYDPAETMRCQAADLARRGHDIQLHLHPQWHRAHYDGSVWHLDHDCLTIDALFETQEETTEFIRQRHWALENISGKPVLAYRAGGFAAQPGGKLLEALVAVGFSIDSSVVKGLHLAKPHPLDYRGAPTGRRTWRVSGAVDREDPAGGLWEIPIHSVMGRRFHQLTFNRLKAKFSRNVPKARQRELMDQLGLKANPASLLSLLFQPVPIKLDYHNLSPTALHRMIVEAPPAPAGDLDVLVTIGHTKEHIDDQAFEKFLKLVAADSSIRAVSFADLAGQFRTPALAGALN